MSVSTTFRKTLAAGAVGLFAFAAAAGLASADHAGETATADQTENLTDGQTITISVTNLKAPGQTTAQIMMANTWPVAGPEAFNLAEFAEAPTVNINPDGTGTFDYTVKIDHGTYNCLQIQCYVVVFQGIGFDSFTGGFPVTFSDGTTDTTEAPAEEEPETTSGSGESDSGGSSMGLIIGIVAAVVVLGGAGAVLAKRRAS